MSLEFTVIVPCHHASRRLPGKLALDLGGKPVLAHTLERAKMSRATKVVAAISHVLLKPIADSVGVESVLTRTHFSGTDRAAEAASSLLLHRNHPVVVLQADEPLIDPETVFRVADILFAQPELDCVTVSRPLQDGEYADPNTVKVIVDREDRAIWFSRAPIPHNRDEPGVPPENARAHLGIYACTAGFLQRYARMEESPDEHTERLEQLRILWHGHKIGVIETDEISIGIDTPADLERARALLKR